MHEGRTPCRSSRIRVSNNHTNSGRSLLGNEQGEVILEKSAVGEGGLQMWKFCHNVQRTMQKSGFCTEVGKGF